MTERNVTHATFVIERTLAHTDVVTALKRKGVRLVLDVDPVHML